MSRKTEKLAGRAMVTLFALFVFGVAFSTVGLMPAIAIIAVSFAMTALLVVGIRLITGEWK